jgi:hypothetical protein
MLHSRYFDPRVEITTPIRKLVEAIDFVSELRLLGADELPCLAQTKFSWPEYQAPINSASNSQFTRNKEHNRFALAKSWALHINLHINLLLKHAVFVARRS